jgi:hypothetical protein
MRSKRCHWIVTVFWQVGLLTADSAPARIRTIRSISWTIRRTIVLLLTSSRSCRGVSTPGCPMLFRLGCRCIVRVWHLLAPPHDALEIAGPLVERAPHHSRCRCQKKRACGLPRRSCVSIAHPQVQLRLRSSGWCWSLPQCGESERHAKVRHNFFRQVFPIQRGSEHWWCKLSVVYSRKLHRWWDCHSSIVYATPAVHHRLAYPSALVMRVETLALETDSTAPRG